MEAVLDFGRGRQKWLKSCYGVCMGGGGGNEARAAASVIASGWGGRGGGGLATVCTPHVCSPLSRSSFSFLHYAVKASFDIKKAYGKQYSKFVSLRYRKKSQDRSFNPPSFRYLCHY